MAERASISKSNTKRDGVEEREKSGERIKGRGGGVLHQAGRYRYSLQGDGWPERVKSCFQRCTVQREILITLD